MKTLTTSGHTPHARLFHSLPPEEIVRLKQIQQASAKLRATVEAGMADLDLARGERNVEAWPVPKFRHAERMLFLFGGSAIALLVVVALFGDAMPFDTACDLCVVMVAAAFTALVMLGLVVVADFRAQKKS